VGGGKKTGRGVVMAKLPYAGEARRAVEKKKKGRGHRKKTTLNFSVCGASLVSDTGEGDKTIERGWMH